MIELRRAFDLHHRNQFSFEFSDSTNPVDGPFKASTADMQDKTKGACHNHISQHRVAAETSGDKVLRSSN